MRRARAMNGFPTWTTTERGSAEVVLPMVLDLLEPRPRSLVDVGCGAAAWASVASELGLDVVGIDIHTPADELQIAADAYVEHDLNQPLTLDRRFDIALCLEVAEHLLPERAATLVADLCKLSDAVLFSAAIPGSGGDGHINEQFQSYWVERFRACGFEAFDLIRPPLWHDQRVKRWYRQNTFLAATGEVAETLSRIAVSPIWDLVQPEHFVALIRGYHSRRVLAQQFVRLTLGRSWDHRLARLSRRFVAR